MYVKVTVEEAARLFARGVHVWDHRDPRWACTFELAGVPRSWKKARRLRKLTRKLKGAWAGPDGEWFVYRKA